MCGGTVSEGVRPRPGSRPAGPAIVHLRGKGGRTEARPVSKEAGSPHRLGRLLDFGVFSFRCGEPQVPSAGVSTACGTRIR